jgi:hypothetical protein
MTRLGSRECTIDRNRLFEVGLCSFWSCHLILSIALVCQDCNVIIFEISQLFQDLLVFSDYFYFKSQSVEEAA